MAILKENILSIKCMVYYLFNIILMGNHVNIMKPVMQILHSKDMVIVLSINFMN